MSGQRRGDDSLDLERRKIELEEQLLNLQERRIDIEQKRIELELRMLKLISKSLKKSKSKKGLNAATRDENDEVTDEVGELQDYEEQIGGAGVTSDDDGDDFEDGDESEDDEHDDTLDQKNRKQMKRSNSSSNGSGKKGVRRRSGGSSAVENPSRNSKPNKALKKQGSNSNLDVSPKGPSPPLTKIRNQDVPTEVTKMRNADFPTEVISESTRRRRMGRRGSAPTGTVDGNASASFYNPVSDAMQRQASLRHLDALLKKDSKRPSASLRDDDQDLNDDGAASVSADSVQTEKRSNKKVVHDQALTGQVITPFQANNPSEAMWK